MKNFLKGKFGTIVILLFTVILAGVAVFTALRLYQLRQQPVAPNAPSSIPKAAENACSLSFTIAPTVVGGCQSLDIYRPTSGTPLTQTQLNALKGGDDVTLCVTGIKGPNAGFYTGATTKVNGVVVGSPLNVDDPNKACITYAIGDSVPAGTTSFIITGQMNTANPPTPAPAPAACTKTFTITPQVPGFSCTGKLAYIDSSKNVPGTYQLDEVIAPGSDIIPGQTIVYTIGYKNTGNTTIASALITDILPSTVSFVDSDPQCTYKSPTRTVICNIGETLSGGESQEAIRVTVLASAPAGSFINKATLSSTGIKSSNCQISLNVQTTSSPTPTPTPTPTTTPTGTPGSTATPNSCGGTCGSNFNCGSGLYCYTTLGLCRNASCPTQADCTCPGGTSATATAASKTSTTPGPTAASLPSSGTDWPTIVGAATGIFVIIGSLLLAL